MFSDSILHPGGVIQVHLLTESKKIKEVVRDSFKVSLDSGKVYHYETPFDLITTLQTLGPEVGFCLIEERALKGVTRKTLSEILNCPIFTIFIKNSENFYLNTPEKATGQEPIFIRLDDLSPTFISLLARVSGQEFQARQNLHNLEDSKMKQAIYVHELRNPLTVIKGKCQSILKSIPPSHKSDPWVGEIIQDCRKILSSCEKIQTISEAAFADIQAEPSKLEATNIQQYQLAELVWAAMEEAAMGFKGTVEIIDDIEPTDIFCNKPSFEGALINLIKNAYEAIKDQKEPWIRITARLKNHLVMLQVTDSGNGIKDAERIFEPYYTTKKNQGGKGIGLQVVQNYFLGIGGRIKYRKDENGNTCFEVEFPISPTS